MDRDLRLPALVLLDEIGAGTDPVEGGALGVAVVDHFRTRGALVVGTTHYDALKTYAQTTPGVQCAAFAFDPVGFAPTYELIYGSPGRSLALEMAGRLGLNRTVIDKARASLGTREAQLATQLARVDQDLAQIAEERKAAARERDALARARAAAERREEELRAREEEFKRKVSGRIDERVRAATRENRRRRRGAEAADLRAHGKRKPVGRGCRPAITARSRHMRRRQWMPRRLMRWAIGRRRRNRQCRWNGAPLASATAWSCRRSACRACSRA